MDAQALARAIALHRSGRLAEADAAYGAILASEPDHADALRLRGLLRFQQGDAAAAVSALARAVERHPDFLQARQSLALVLDRLGRREEALVQHAEAARLAPRDPGVRNDLGCALMEAGRLEEAVAVLVAALAVAPDHADALTNLAVALDRSGRAAQALAAASHAAALRPDHAGTLSNLSIMLASAGALGPAERAARRAVRLGPLEPTAWTQLGNVLIDVGEPDAAVSAYSRALALAPDSRAVASNRLYALTLSPTVDDDAVAAEFRSWGGHQPVPGPRPATSADPERVLRIGYVSADFGRHPVGWFLSPVLANHDPAQVEAWCYSGRRREDEVSARLAGHARVWRRVAGLDDEALTRLIRDDGIDILVDLSGHTAGNRLGVFARGAAPVQATWGGLIGTSALAAVDWLIADRHGIPPDLEPLYAERIWRLPDGYVCYGPPDYAPEPGPLPARAAGRITFGCFNRLAKLNDGTLALWARVLDAVPGSRLLLKTKELSCPELRRRTSLRLAGLGIGPDRLTLAEGAPHPALLAAYGEVDVALDPFPYSGGLTTLEAFWMGVPVVTLPGRRFVSRHTLTHASVLGRPEWVAHDADAYVRIAAGLARDLDALSSIRAGLRAEMAASPLCDGPRFTRNLEAAFRAMWREWCTGRE
jgi:protein O-GlcNAc transferase